MRCRAPASQTATSAAPAPPCARVASVIVRLDASSAKVIAAAGASARRDRGSGQDAGAHAQNAISKEQSAEAHRVGGQKRPHPRRADGAAAVRGSGPTSAGPSIAIWLTK